MKHHNMSYTDLKHYQEATGLNFVMFGTVADQGDALRRFADLIIEEYVAEHPCRESLADDQESVNAHYITDEYIAKIYEEEVSGHELRPQDKHIVNKFARAMWVDAVEYTTRMHMSEVETYIKIPCGLPKPNERVAIIDSFGKLDICTFITQSDGGWFFDNLVDCVYQSYEVKEWRVI